ncbi:MAG: TetR family transcriptional regulator [Xanthomonadales bacterium]|nr:TetR family transcriptional regulator [Xanthomonadales bacterium]
MKDKREQIEAAATQAIQKGGLNSVSFRDLAEEVGVKSSSVHYHFRTKADLAQSVVRDYTARFDARLAEIDRSESTLDGKLQGLAQVFEDVLSGNDFCLCGMMAAELNGLDGPTRLALRGFFEMSEQWLEKALSGSSSGLALGLSSHQWAMILMSGLEGAILVDRLTDSRERLNAFRALARAAAT